MYFTTFVLVIAYWQLQFSSFGECLMWTILYSPSRPSLECTFHIFPALLYRFYIEKVKNNSMSLSEESYLTKMFRLIYFVFVQGKEGVKIAEGSKLSVKYVRSPTNTFIR